MKKLLITAVVVGAVVGTVCYALKKLDDLVEAELRDLGDDDFEEFYTTKGNITEEETEENEKKYIDLD